MNSASWASYRAAAEVGDNEDDGPSHCPDCGIWFAEITDGHVLAGEDAAGRDCYVAVNAETGCLCSPEDLEHGPVAPPNLDDLPF